MDKTDLILVVDDNSECRTVLMSVLERHGFRTISATCGREGVKLAIAFQPRLVLMDLRMTGMDGYEATLSIHGHPRGRRIPVVAVSADCGDHSYSSRAFGVGFVASLGKPWDEGALLRIVKKILARGVKRHLKLLPSFRKGERTCNRASRSAKLPHKHDDRVRGGAQN
jgi:CheY-like chemotaxis protein